MTRNNQIVIQDENLTIVTYQTLMAIKTFMDKGAEFVDIKRSWNGEKIVVTLFYIYRRLARG